MAVCKTRPAAAAPLNSVENYSIRQTEFVRRNSVRNVWRRGEKRSKLKERPLNHHRIHSMCMILCKSSRMYWWHFDCKRYCRCDVADGKKSANVNLDFGNFLQKRRDYCMRIFHDYCSAHAMHECNFLIIFRTFAEQCHSNKSALRVTQINELTWIRLFQHEINHRRQIDEGDVVQCEFPKLDFLRIELRVITRKWIAACISKPNIIATLGEIVSCNSENKLTLIKT